ncbi:T6SS immunity protein Tdi1 domain-containing protein [Cypionkella psychrotolerans]|uniref:T6SS immunity protein Tdi1 domain-containing protein n=1 Tax=Cypionkella psychrotolerans TaxID=1678131 RepID=UPI0006B6980D|nr:T6SS immunity protein Tdi1 domain-containing protein [Cypionkella psychrotolerans]
MDLLSEISEHWGWSGLKAIEIAGQNEFGNFLIEHEDGSFWRICPEELGCEVVAKNAGEFSRLTKNHDFLLDWEMSELVELARRNLGALEAGWVYYLVIPSVFGGEYEATNIRAVPLGELIEFSGNWALAVKDLPDGVQVEVRIID